jgi:hypothetical protein
MRKSFALLLLAAFSVSCTLTAGETPREIFPSDYTPSPCAADAAAVCETMPKENFVPLGRQFRGFSLDRKWIDAHWDEMRAAFLPICAKIGSCFTVPGNDSIFCLDLIRSDFVAKCDRFPVGTKDHDQCTMFATTWVAGLGIKKDLHRQAQACAAATPAGEARTLEAWTVPATIGPDFDGTLRVYAIDASTKIPVRARVKSDGPGVLRSTEGPYPTAGAVLAWDARLKRVANAQGHTDVVAPSLTFEADGYAPITIPVDIAIGTMIVDMIPAPEQLKPGKNLVTVAARDASTGKPVEARVMYGEWILGETNKPLELEVKPGTKRLEIWVTSLFDKYSDVVVVPAEK